MDFDIGNLFYFIVLIIAAISGIFGKKKKQAPGGKAKSGGIFQKLEKQLEGLVDEAKTSVDNVKEEIAPSKKSIPEEDYSGYESIKEEPTEVFTEPLDTYQSPYMQYEGVFDPDYSENKDLPEAEAVTTTESEEILQVVELEEEENPDYFEIVKDFDLGTAVLYSAVLNRQDY